MRKRYRLFQVVGRTLQTLEGSRSFCRGRVRWGFRGFVTFHYYKLLTLLRVTPLACRRTFILLPLAFADILPAPFPVDLPRPLICYHSSRSGVSGYRIWLWSLSVCVAWCTGTAVYTRQPGPFVSAYEKIDIGDDKCFGVEGRVGLVSSLGFVQENQKISGIFLPWKMPRFLWRIGFSGVYIPFGLIYKGLYIWYFWVFQRVFRSACKLGHLWRYRFVVFLGPHLWIYSVIVTYI